MYSGLEIDMLSLGNADSILVSFWNGYSVNRVLIDGGNKGDAPIVRAFLRGLKIETIDDVLSTHHHDDHSGGLIELLADETLKFGKVRCHVPHWHVDNMDKVWAALKAAEPSDEATAIRKSLQTVADIYDIAKKRRIPLEEPFKGKRVGVLEVCSPTEEFYNGLVVEMTDVGKIKAEDEAQTRYDIQTNLEEVMSKAILGESSDSSLLTEPHTAPENESSVVAGITHDKKVCLFTADAGPCALTNVLRDYPGCKKLFWMQIPHHGSRRNVTKNLIDLFAPSTAFVSAEGSKKHPRRAVVNAFKDAGAKVYSTHYPNPLHLRQCVGTVPGRDGYESATALYDAEKLAKKSEADWSGLAAILGGSK
jgi:beta-lactamase superfamily II metal-dependent hydrolase